MQDNNEFEDAEELYKEDMKKDMSKLLKAFIIGLSLLAFIYILFIAPNKNKSADEEKEAVQVIESSTVDAAEVEINSEMPKEEVKTKTASTEDNRYIRSQEISRDGVSVELSINVSGYQVVDGSDYIEMKGVNNGNDFYYGMTNVKIEDTEGAINYLAPNLDYPFYITNTSEKSEIKQITLNEKTAYMGYVRGEDSEGKDMTQVILMEDVGVGNYVYTSLCYPSNDKVGEYIDKYSASAIAIIEKTAQ